MTTVNRRRFLQLGALGTGLGGAIPTRPAFAGAPVTGSSRPIWLSGDGVGLSPPNMPRCSTG